MKVTYSADSKTAFYCGYKFRKDPNTGYYLCSKNTDIGKRERLHNFIWRKAYGDIPNGYHIHHKDRNKDNNVLSNLVMLSNHDHGVIHGKLLSDEERKKRRENLLINATPKAKEWHKSEQGKQWHSKHSKETWESKQLNEYKCTNCGCLFYTKKTYALNVNHFCGNNCKATYRRKSGVDNIERQCQKCKKTFSANKYSKIKYCESCRCGEYRENR